MTAHYVPPAAVAVAFLPPFPLFPHFGCGKCAVAAAAIALSDLLFPDALLRIRREGRIFQLLGGGASGSFDAKSTRKKKDDAQIRSAATAGNTKRRRRHLSIASLSCRHVNIPHGGNPAGFRGQLAAVMRSESGICRCSKGNESLSLSLPMPIIEIEAALGNRGVGGVAAKLR